MSLGSVVLSKRYLTNPATVSDRGATAGSATGAFNTLQDMNTPVRRPMRGIQLRGDTYGTIRVASTTDDLEVLYSSSSRPAEGSTTARVSATTEMMIQSISVSRQEKFQAVPTFGAAQGFFFGEQHFFHTVQAILLDTEDFPWRRDWWANYEDALRGTRLAERGARVVLTVNGNMIEGYLTGASTSESAESPGIVSLNFTIWTTNVIYEGEAGSGYLSYGGQRPVVPSLQEQMPTLPSSRPGLGAEDAAVVGGLRGVLQQIAGIADRVRTALSDFRDDVEDFLLGKDIVIPALGYTDPMEVLAPEEAARIREQVQALTPPMSFTETATAIVAASRGYTWENWDEYIQGFEGFLRAEQESWASVLLGPPWLGEGAKEALERAATAKLTAQMQQLEPRWMLQVNPITGELLSSSGYRPSVLTRTLGRSAFAAISLAAAYSRADEDAQRIFGGYSAIEAQQNLDNAVPIRDRPASATPLPRDSAVSWPTGTYYTTSTTI